MHLDKHLLSLASQYGTWIYAILFAIVFSETGLVIFPFLPGDSLLFVAGSVAATGGLDVGTLCFVLLLATILGDNFNYWIGFVVGPKAFRWEQSRYFNKAALIKTHNFYETHGSKIVIIARFIPLARTFAPFVAGIGRMTYIRFLSYDFLGGVMWVGVLVLIGYWFGNQPAIKNNLGLATLAIIAISALPPTVAWLKHRPVRSDR